MGCGASKDAPPAGEGSAPPAAKPSEPPKPAETTAEPPKPAETTAVQAVTDTTDTVVQKPVPAAAAAATASVAPPAKTFSASSLEDLPDLDNGSLPPEAIRQLSADIDAELESIMKAGDDAQAKEMFAKFDKVNATRREEKHGSTVVSTDRNAEIRTPRPTGRSPYAGRTSRARSRSRSCRPSSSRSTSS